MKKNEAEAEADAEAEAEMKEKVKVKDKVKDKVKMKVEENGGSGRDSGGDSGREERLKKKGGEGVAAVSAGSVFRLSKLFAVAVVAVLVFSLALSAAAGSAPVLPDSYYGSLTINGKPAPAGVTLVSKIDGVYTGNLTTKEPGMYGDREKRRYLVVEGTADDIGDDISLYVKEYDGGLVEAASMDPAGLTFESGAVEQVNVTFTGVQLTAGPSFNNVTALEVQQTSAVLSTSISTDYNGYSGGEITFFYRQLDDGDGEGDGWMDTGYERVTAGSYSTEVTGLSPSTAYTFYPYIEVDGAMDGFAGSRHSFRTLSGGNEPPVAAFEYTPGAPQANTTVSFADSSTDSDGGIVNWSWSFGDGATSNETDPLHVYPTAGNYTVTVTVTDDDGATDSATTMVEVTAADTGGNGNGNGTGNGGGGGDGDAWLPGFGGGWAVAALVVVVVLVLAARWDIGRGRGGG